jgi:hypothetical protein
VKYGHLVTKKNQVLLITRIFVKRKNAKVAGFRGICFSRIAIFRQLLPSGGQNIVLRKITLVLGLLSSPIPSFAGGQQSKEILLNLGMKC